MGGKIYQEIVNETGRVFRVGETPKQVLGYPRIVVILCAWIAMMMAGVLEYSWGAIGGTLAADHNWGIAQYGWLLSVFVIFEAGISPVTGYLRERGILPVRWAVTIGGIVCGIAAYGWLSVVPNGPVGVIEAYLSYAALGGLGSGLVYSSCINIVQKWYPEKKGLRTGFVDGGWAYGALPFLIAFGGGFSSLTVGSGYALTPSLSQINSFILLQGIIMTVVIVIVGQLMRDPPKNWWPSSVDPLQWQKRSTRDLQKNGVSFKHYSPREVWATPQSKWIGVQFALFVGSSLFGVAYYFPFALAMNLGVVAAVGGFAGFGVADGVCRALYGKLSEYLGRWQTLQVIYFANFVFQLLTLGAGLIHNAPLFAVAAIISGGFSGANFALTPSLVADYYGETRNATNYGTMYIWKALGGSFAGGIAGLIMTGSVFSTATPTTADWINGFAFGALLALLAVITVHFGCKRPTLEQFKKAIAKTAAKEGATKTTDTS